MQKNNRPFVEATLILCAILAILCMSAGVIAFFAHNWDWLPKTARLFLSFVPVLLGIAVFYKAFFHHHASRVWMESSAAFLVLMTGSSVILVSQVYHIGDFSRIMLIWMLLSLPVLYLAKSSAVTIIYLAGITWRLVMQSVYGFWFFGGMGVPNPYEVLGYWLLIAAVVPHFMQFYKNGAQTLRTQILGWFAIVIVLFGANLGFLFHPTVGYSLAISLAYVLGKKLFPGGNYFWQRPFQTIALLAATILAFFLSNSYFIHYCIEFYYDDYGMYSHHSSETAPHIVNYLLLAVFAFLILFFFVRDLWGERKLNPFLVFFPFVVIIGLLLAWYYRGDDSAWWMSDRKFLLAKLWFNLYIVSFCAFYLYKGIVMRINGIVTYAIFMLSFLLLIRYIDINISAYLKGIIYVGVGVALLLFNKFYTAKALETERQVKPIDNNTLDQ